MILALVLASLPACSKKPVEVTGQIFVVTKGAQNIKMGGLPVRVFPHKEFQKMAKATVTWMQDEVRYEAQRKVDSDYMGAFIKELMAMEESAENPIPQLPQIRKTIVTESGMDEKIGVSALYADLLPRSIEKLISGATTTLGVRSDADGRFTVPVSEETWFFTVGQRDVGEETEEYIWIKRYIVPEGSTKPSVSISNDAIIYTEEALYSVLSAAAGAPRALEDFRKVTVSEEMKALVARHREAADAAKAKAEREAAEAKAKAEREAAEAKAKLSAEINAGRVGSTLGLPLAGNLVMPFAFCPAGSFKMGSPSAEDGHSSDENQVSVSLSKAFWMAKTEVTQAQWRAVMGSDPSHFKGDDLPVEVVSWDDAQKFIKKVNDSGVIPEGWKVALPTEAQWEYACRAGETGPYSGGTIEQVAWYDGNRGSKTRPVGTKKPNAWGLYDMHGNVWEWCADWYDDSLSGGTDPSGPSSGVYRVVRGGSWRGNAARCRAAVRSWNPPDSRFDPLGFRPALVPSE